MFNGIVKHTGKINAIFKKDKDCRMEILSKIKFLNSEVGASVSCSGSCLTLEKIKGANINSVKQTCTKLLKILELENMSVDNSVGHQEQVENTQQEPESYSVENTHSNIDFNN